jgi:bifunctional isochorismate lyase/aryl carrier protein
LADSAWAAEVLVLYTVGTAEREATGRGIAFGHPRFPGDDDSRAVVDAIRPRVGDSVLPTKRFSAFAAPGCAAALRRWGATSR